MNSIHMEAENADGPGKRESHEGPRDYSLAEETPDTEEIYRRVRSGPSIPPGRFAAWILLGSTAVVLIITAFLKGSPLPLRYALVIILLSSMLYLLFSRRNQGNEAGKDENGAIV